MKWLKGKIAEVCSSPKAICWGWTKYVQNCRRYFNGYLRRAIGKR